MPKHKLKALGNESFGTRTQIFISDAYVFEPIKLKILCPCAKKVVLGIYLSEFQVFNSAQAMVVQLLF